VLYTQESAPAHRSELAFGTGRFASLPHRVFSALTRSEWSPGPHGASRPGPEGPVVSSNRSLPHLLLCSAENPASKIVEED
jgi:hypothetical protein